MRSRAVVALSLALCGAAAVAACVGDDPNVGGGATATPEAGGGGSETGTPSTGDGGTNPGDDGGGATGGGGGGDGGPRCDPAKPFAFVKLMAGVNTAEDEYDVIVTPDELTVYVAVSVLDAPSDILKATRKDRDGDFGALVAAQEMRNVNAGNARIRAMSMTDDGLALYTERGGATTGVGVSIRASTTAVFSAPVPVRGRGQPLSDIPADPFIAGDGKALYVASGTTANDMAIRQLPRDTTMTYGDGGLEDFGISSLRDELDTAGGTSRKPVVNKDSTVMIFASSRAPGSTSNLDMFITTRAGIGGTFVAPTRLADPVSSAADDRPGSISSDGCVLYFTSDRAGGLGKHDVWMARRGK